jgi:hypothetical protein
MAPFLTDQEKLKYELQSDKSSSKLENLAAGLVGLLLDVPIAVAKSGFQHGGDAGPAGQQGRRFRIECKKYSDETALSDRELLGEIDQALGRDEALEAWFLVATRDVPEQLAQDLVQKGERLGVPVIIIDWKDNQLAPLAALCASNPDFVAAVFSKNAGEFARALQPASDEAIAAIRRNFQSWALGFESLRARSHLRLEDIWSNPRTSNAELAQDASGGARPKKVRRQSVHAALDAWWQGPAQKDSPAAIIGWDGVGKTWAALDWLTNRKANQPIVLVVPSSAFAPISGASEAEIKRFLADRLYELSAVRDPHHWRRRLDYLLMRPKEEGPVLTVLFDGLNQEPSVSWLPILKALQGNTFEGRLRVMVTTRTYHFQDKLSDLRGLVVQAVRIPVEVYDAAPGGELDQMLAFEGLKQADLHPDLLELARTPRLFNLVVRFRDRLVEAGQVTVHRLLWEYGRDTFGERAGKSFSETEWREWLAEIARRYRDGVQEFSLKTLGEMASRPDLSAREVYARLSDIIDGQFARPGPAGTMQLSPTVVAHALGTALLARLDAIGTSDFLTIETEVTGWLDPISGLDQRAEILRAAVSILVERGMPANAKAGVLVTAWLQTQNITDSHRRELANLATIIPEALLDAVEHSDARAQASARLWAVNALRAIPRSAGPALDAIIARLRSWLSIVSREVDNRRDVDAQFEKQRAERYRARIGVDASGPITVLGVPLQLVERADGALQATAPSILEGFPLIKVLPCFEVAAVALAVRGHADGWDGFKWLCYLNEVDPLPMVNALRELSEAVRNRPPKPGVHLGLPARAAALLLWLSGREQDENTAVSIEPGIDRSLTYEKHYLPNPAQSFFALERRHADIVLNDKAVAINFRIHRTSTLWLDPNFTAPISFIDDLRAAASAFDVQKLNEETGPSRESHLFEELEPVLARCAPDLLAALCRRKMQGIASSPLKSRYLTALHSTAHIILAGNLEASAAQTLRLLGRETDQNNEAIAASQLLMLELWGLDARSQFDRLIAADLKFIPTVFTEVLHIPTANEVDQLIAEYRGGTDKQQHDLIVLLSVHPIAFSDGAWSWLSDLARQPTHELCGVLFRTLTLSNAARFGRSLAADDWSWQPQADLWVNHYGTGALIKAEPALPFEQLAPRLAPWRLLEAARVRGADPGEVQLAAEIFGRILAAEKIEEPDPGSTLTIEPREHDFPPFVFVKPRSSIEERRPLMDPDAYSKEYQRAFETAHSRIEEARKSGASLYLTEIKSADFDPVLQHASDMLDRWLEGCAERTSDFRRRVRLAEAAFLALCEALLVSSPPRGADLWRALRVTMTTHYVGAAGVDELLHIIFRVPDSESVAELRYEAIALPHCHTDQVLFNVALAATYNGKAAWLKTLIEEDHASSFVWRQRRGIVMAGFTVDNTLPVPDAWPEGEIRTGYADLRRRAAQFRWREACANHWWRAFLAAQDTVEAYAAWILFLRSADRRAWTWMRNSLGKQDVAKDLTQLKRIQFELNRSELKQAMDQRLEKFDRTFLNQDTVYGVGPWGASS